METTHCRASRPIPASSGKSAQAVPEARSTRLFKGIPGSVALSVGLLLAATAGRSVAEPPSRAGGGSAKPAVWMMPPAYDNGRCFRDLFEQPDAWRETRSVIDVLGYADHNLDTDCNRYRHRNGHAHHDRYSHAHNHRYRHVDAD